MAETDTALIREGESPADDESGDVSTDVFGRAVVPEGTESAEPEDLAPVLEAVCYALNRPLTIREAAEIMGVSAAAAQRAADELAATLRGRGVMLQRHQDELQLVTRGEVAWAVHRALNPEKPSRLSKAALETLAIIAYRQPVTRGRVEGIRGVSCDAVIESLERRGLITEMGRQDSPGQPHLWGTTLRFLQIVGLERIEDLPDLPEGVTVPDIDDAAWDVADGLLADDEDDTGDVATDEVANAMASEDFAAP